MKHFSKLIAFVLAIVLAFSLTPVAFAGKASSADNSENVVATVSLCSCIYTFPVSGHTWIYVENLSDKIQRVGLYDVPVDQGVSIGSFSFSVSDGWGLYYNLEAYRENRDNNAGNHWVVTKGLTQSELDDLSDYIAHYLNYWDLYFNCAFFSFSTWNHVSHNLLIPLVIPAISQLEVIMAGAKKGTMKMYCPSKDQIFRQSDSGSSAQLVPVSEKTLNS